MSTFEPEWPGLPSEDEISEYLALAGCDDPDEPAPAPRAPRAGAHPYAPATDRPRPSWRGGPPIGLEAELGYEDERNDQ